MYFFYFQNLCFLNIFLMFQNKLTQKIDLPIFVSFRIRNAWYIVKVNLNFYLNLIFKHKVLIK